MKNWNVDEVWRKKDRVLFVKLISGLHNPLFTLRLKNVCGNSKNRNGTKCEKFRFPDVTQTFSRTLSLSEILTRIFESKMSHPCL